MRIRCPKCKVGELNTMEVYESSKYITRLKAGCSECSNTEILTITLEKDGVTVKSEKNGCKIIPFPTDYVNEDSSHQ
jgi:hypothetical protein